MEEFAVLSQSPTVLEGWIVVVEGKVQVSMAFSVFSFVNVSGNVKLIVQVRKTRRTKARDQEPNRSPVIDSLATKLQIAEVA